MTSKFENQKHQTGKTKTAVSLVKLKPSQKPQFSLQNRTEVIFADGTPLVADAGEHTFQR